jgi:hypothetical protein
MSLFDEMENAQGININEILNKMVTGEADLEQKSHILDPVALMLLKTLAGLLEQYKLSTSAKTLETVIKYYLLYMISYKRMSREEIIFAVSQMMKDKELTIKQEMLGTQRKKGWGR